MHIQTFTSDLSGREFPLTERVSCGTIRKPLLDLIQKEHPHVHTKCHVAISELNTYRQQYFESFFKKELHALTALEKTVLDKLRDNETITDKLENESAASLTYGQKLADKIADFGGSWTFIITFLAFILAWMGVNVYWLVNKGFDPYPFILLNLILSCLAALQAPVIMMSQNRQEEKDRLRAKNDYMINLKSELAVRILHEKIDHLIIHQQQDMLELQQTQIEMLTEVNNALKRIVTDPNNQTDTDSDQ